MPEDRPTHSSARFPFFLACAATAVIILSGCFGKKDSVVLVPEQQTIAADSNSVKDAAPAKPSVSKEDSISPGSESDAAVVAYHIVINQKTRRIESFSPVIEGPPSDFTIWFNGVEIEPDDSSAYREHSREGLNSIMVQLDDENLNGNFAFIFFRLEKGGRAGVSEVSGEPELTEKSFIVMDRESQARYSELLERGASVEEAISAIVSENEGIEREIEASALRHERSIDSLKSEISETKRRTRDTLEETEHTVSEGEAMLDSLAAEDRARQERIRLLESALEEKPTSVDVLFDSTVTLTLDSLVMDTVLKPDVDTLEFSPKGPTCVRFSARYEQGMGVVEAQFNSPDSTTTLFLFQNGKCVGSMPNTNRVRFEIPGEDGFKEYRVLAVNGRQAGVTPARRITANGAKR